MLKTLALLARLSVALALGATPAFAQFAVSDQSSQRASVGASSGTVAAATASATLGAVQGKTTYICGFAITSTGSTAAAVVAPTVTNVVGGTQTYEYASVAGATLANAPLIVPIAPCLPASAVNTSIVVSMPSLGAGNTNASVNAWGYQY